MLHPKETLAHVPKVTLAHVLISAKRQSLHILTTILSRSLYLLRL